MKRVSYCGQSFLTTDGAADALLHLAVALPAGSSTELVELPALTTDGHTILVQLVIGPTSEFLSVPERTRATDPDTVGAVAYLRERARMLTTQAEPSPAGVNADVNVDLHADVDADAGALCNNGWDDLYGL